MRNVLLRLLCVVPAIVLAILGYQFYVGRLSPPARGRALSNRAFDASFSERGLPIPAGGPREGYWGDRLKRKVPDRRLGWREVEDSRPEFFENDEQGCQHFRPQGEPAREILILGGSVAWGAYASSVQQVYFAAVGRALVERGLPAHITVLAAGAWKSHQDLRAMEIRLEEGDSYDLIIFLNGLNDLTGGPTFDTLYNGASVETLGSDESSETDLDPEDLRHEGDFPERVEAYLTNMRRASGIAAAAGAELVVALQPGLQEREHPSVIEQEIRRSAETGDYPDEALREAYAALREGLTELARRDGVTFLDLSRLFEKEKATTFIDTWHFTDPGHRLLAGRLTAVVEPILRNR